MKQLKRILIANNSMDGLDVALAKAALIEHYTGAELELAEVVYDTIAEEPESLLPAEQRARLIEAMKAAERNGLRNRLTPIEGKVASVEPRVIWSKDAAQGLLDEAARTGAGLIIKPASAHHQLGDLMHTPLDWALMRGASCAVLISKQRAWKKSSPVLAAVDPTDTEHAVLTREVLVTAATLAKVLGSNLHLVAAYPSLGQSVSGLQVAMDYQGIKDDMRAARQEALEHWITELKLDEQPFDIQIHVLEGRPADAIPRLANELDVALTVLGTAARKGLAKLVLGNTSEAIISRLVGDVVTVREPWNSQ